MARNNAIVWIVIIVAALLLYQGGFFNSLLGKGSKEVSEQYPSDLKQSLTINTKDALASTDTDADVSYYLFDDKGAWVKSGATVNGTATIDINYGKEYTIIAYSDSAYYPVTETFKAEGGQSIKTLNLALNPVSNATIVSLRDPVDLDSNISSTAGSQVDFDLIYKVTSPNSAINEPIIVVDVNQTSVQDVYLSGLNKVTCPTRISVGSGRKLFCFQDTTLLSKNGLRTVSGNVLFSSSITPSKTDLLYVTIIDKQMYADPNYATVGISAFKVGAENPNTLADVGASDSVKVGIGFAG